MSDAATPEPRLQFFGDYLVERGIVTDRQVRQATDHIYFLNRTLGEIAIARGYMYAQDVNRVLELQRGCDRLFGELAVALDLLRPEQVDELLAEQTAQQAKVGEALVELGHLGEAEMHKFLQEFEAEQAQLVWNPAETPRDLQETDAPAVIDLFRRQALRTSLLCVKVGRGRPFAPTAPHDFEVTTIIPTQPRLSIGLACSQELGRGLGATVRGTFVAQITREESQQALAEFLGHVARLVTSEPVEIHWGQLPRAGSAFDFVSPQGGGTLILERL